MRPLKAHVTHAEKIAAAVPSAYGDGEKRSTAPAIWGLFGMLDLSSLTRNQPTPPAEEA